MNIENQVTNIEVINPEISEEYNCKICQINKNKDSFYKLIQCIDNTLIKEEHYTHICKDCLPIKAIEINQYNKIHIIQKFLNEQFWINQIKKLENEKGIKFEDLISRQDAIKELTFKTKDSSSINKWFKHKERVGIINAIKLFINCKNFEKGIEKEKSIQQYNIFYLKKEIEILKFIINNGELYIRTKKVADRGIKLCYNSPYLFIGKDNKEYIFHNKKQKIKPCKLCLNVKNENDFYHSKSGKITDICKECHANECTARYKNLEPEKKKERLTCQKIYVKNNYNKIKKQRQQYESIHKKERNESRKKWRLENKDKVRLYRKIRNGRIENKIKRNLRKRVQDVIKDKINGKYIGEFSFYLKDFGCNKYELIKYIESKFQPDMNWNNYGSDKYEKDENNNLIRLQRWQIDHIKPVSSFNIDNKEEIKKINHYTNLLPMWAEDNNKKSDRTELCPILDKEFLEKYKELEVLIKKG